MTESTAPEPQTAPEAVAAPTEQNQNDLPQWARDTIAKANKEAANYRTQVAELKPRAEQFAALEEASKSDAQRLQDAATAALQQAQEAQSETLRLRVALKHGISEDDFDLLGSGTEEQIAGRAQRIAGLRAAAAAVQNQPPAPTSPSRRPVEQLRPGATPTTQLSEDDQVYAAIFGPQA